MDEALDELQLAPRLQLSLDKAIANYKQTDDFIGMKADGRTQLQEQISSFLPTMAVSSGTNAVRKKDDILLMGPNKGKDFDKFYTAIAKDANLNANFVRDITKLVITFEDPEGVELAKNMYIANMERIGKTPSEQDINTFIEKITSDDKSYAIKFATVMVGNNGFKKIDRKFKRDVRTYDSSGVKIDLDRDYTYDVFSNPLSSILDDGIKTPSESKSGQYELDSSWNKMNKASQISSFDKHVNILLKSKIKDSNKELLIENLFENVQEPHGFNFEEYMEYFNKKYIQVSPYESIIGKD
jgi:hypothetical protein